MVIMAIIATILYIKYKGKQDVQLLKDKERKKKEYILSKINNYQKMKNKNFDAEFDKDYPDRNLDKEKLEFIQKIKSIKKEQIFEVKKYTLWQRIKKTLGL
jgi:hypothetical protein